MGRQEVRRIAVSPELSRQFATMSFLSAVLIVALHSLSAMRAGPLVWAVNEFIKGSLCATAIPWFFFAAGFFLAGHIGEDGWWKDALCKRVRTLLVPFWCWSAIVFVFHVLIAYVIHRVGHPFGGEDALEWLSVHGVLRMVGLYPFNEMPTMWFMRTLFVFVVLSPVLVRFNRLLLLALFVFHCAFSSMSPLNKEIWSLGGNLLSVRGLFYFTSGLLVRQGLLNGLRFSTRLSWTITIIGLIMTILRLIVLWNGIDARLLTTLQVPPLMFGLFSLCGRLTLPKSLTDYSFPVYVTHMMIVFFYTGILSVLGFGGYANLTFFKSILLFAISLTSSLAVCGLMRKKMPRLSHILFGGR